MPLNSFNFFLVFPIVFLVYWLIPAKRNCIRNAFLIIFSYALYMNWKPAFAIALLGVSIITFLGSICIERYSQRRFALVVTFVFLGILPLLVFKYYNFLNVCMHDFLRLLGINFALPGLNWAIPVGISFFTFQAVGYLLDVYHNRINAEHDIVDYVLFISFFPQVTSGPISTANNLLPQIKEPKCFQYFFVKNGLKMFLWGLFLKHVLADRIGIYVDTIFANYMHYSGAQCLFASVMYSIQIYCDFAGYSLMALGVAKAMGFNLINNFERPYFASSVTEFWRRWHVSLTKWLTTHVYINLGGNKCSLFRKNLNIMITFLVSGLWHGANWTFVVWGLIHGFFQIIEKKFWGNRIKLELKCRSNKFSVLKLLRCCVTFIFVTFAWVFFRSDSLTDAVEFLSRIIFSFGKFSFDPMDLLTISTLSISMPLLFLKEVRAEYFSAIKINKAMKWLFYVYVFFLVMTIGILDGGNFIYVNF